MAPGRKKGSARAAAAAAARQQWKVGDLVLAKMKGFPAWPAMVSEPEKWGYSSDRKKLLVYFYGTKQIAFCNYADVEAFTEEKKKSLLTKRQGKGADFVRAVDEIVDIYEKLKVQHHAKINSGDEGTMSSAGDSEASRSIFCNKSPELSSDVTNCHQAESVVLTESGDLVNPEHILASSMEVDLHNGARDTNEQTGTVSILDQLRQSHLSNTTGLTRKLRDSPLQSFTTQKRMTSFRRCRRPSGNDLYKIQNSAMAIDSNKSGGGDLIPDSGHEDLTLKQEAIEDSTHVSCDTNRISPVSSCLPLNGTTEDILTEIAPLQSEVINMNGGNILGSNCKVEYSGTGYFGVDKLNGDFLLNDKLDIVPKMGIPKKRRKPNRKQRVTCATEFAEEVNQEAEIQGEMGGNHLEPPVSPNETNERSYTADGDEHLPLVKRARVRMSKLPVPANETQNNGNSGVNDKSDTILSTDKSGKYIASPSSENTCPDSTVSSSIKETSATIPVNNGTLSPGKNRMFWNATKYQLKEIPLDAEAALPPSKRLHRALEAMSANTAEATNNIAEAPRAMECVHMDSVDSPRTSPHHPSTEGCAGSLEKSEGMQPSDSSAFQNCAARSLSSLSSDNVEVPLMTSSESKLDATPIEDFKSFSNKGYIGVGVDAKDCDGSSNFKPSNKKSLDNGLQSRPVDFIEKQENALSVQSLSLELPSSEGRYDKLFSPLRDEKSDQKMQPTKKSLDSRINNFCGDVRSSVKNSSVSYSKEGGNILPPSVPTTVLSPRITGSMTGNSSRMTKSANSSSNDGSHDRDMQDGGKEVCVDRTPKDQGASLDLTPMKNLIAAAQAKRLLARSSSFHDIGLDGKTSNNSVSPFLVHRDESSGQGTPKDSTTCRINALDGSNHLQNGRRTSNGGSHQKHFDKVPSHEDANAVLKIFEDLLSNLSRTKESIGRATRVAIDCAKYGFAGEVIDVLLQNLERELSLSRKVDLFFLVDSITQYSRSQKGGAGDVYPSLVQSVLPRLLSAAAPTGSAAFENRRQCLKVLRVWLERKALPESVVRHHMRELEYANEAPFSSTYSRRPSRTERAIDDPVREMEGMLVDEYGSNTSFQIPSFLHPNLFEDEEGSSDDEKSFEAVTPESNVEVDDDKGTTQDSTEKHRHVLEDVDGELEMEDLAPLSCTVDGNSVCQVSGGNIMFDSRYQIDQHPMVAYAPPLPEDRPPSPPPLPSSPPPLPLSPSYHNNPSGSMLAACNISNVPPVVSISLPPPNKAYHLPPPPPTVSNQFSYVQIEPQQTQSSWGNPSSSISDRFQYIRNNQRGCYYGDRGMPIQHEISERSRFSSAVPVEPSTRWSLPPRPSNYPPPATRPLQGSISRVPGAAPGYWRPG